MIVSFSSFIAFNNIALPFDVILLSVIFITVSILFILKQSARLSANISHKTFLDKSNSQRVIFYLKADMIIAPLIEFIALLLKLSLIKV